MVAHADVPLLVREWDATAFASTSNSATPDSSARPDMRYGFQVCHRPDVPSERWPKVVSEPGVDYTMPAGTK